MVVGMAWHICAPQTTNFTDFRYTLSLTVAAPWGWPLFSVLIPKCLHAQILMIQNKVHFMSAENQPYRIIIVRVLACWWLPYIAFQHEETNLCVFKETTKRSYLLSCLHYRLNEAINSHFVMFVGGWFSEKLLRCFCHSGTNNETTWELWGGGGDIQ